MTVPRFPDTPGERFPRALWCINEELLQLSACIKCGRGLRRICRGCRSSRRSGSSGPGLSNSGFSNIIVFSPKISTSVRQNNGVTSFKLHGAVVRGGGRGTNGRTWGIPSESHTSNHINGNNRTLPVGLLNADGKELCLMCLTSFGMTHVNLCKNLWWSPGSQWVSSSWEGWAFQHFRSSTFFLTIGKRLVL